MDFNTEYILVMEHQLIQDGLVVDANISMVHDFGPSDEKEAFGYFKSTKNTDYTNIHNVQNKLVVREIYRRCSV